MKVIIAGKEDQSRWDQYIKNHAAASPYHFYAWGQSVEEAYGHKKYYLMVEDQGIAGVLPLIHMKPFWGSGGLVSLPFCDLGGVLADGSAAADLLYREALSLARHLNEGFVEFRTSLLQMDSGQQEVQTKSHKVRMVMDITQEAEVIWGNFKSKLRSQVRKSEKNGCIFQWGGLEYLDVFYDVFSLNMRDLGSPVHSRAWFEAIIKNYGSDLKMGLVSFKGENIGVGLILCHPNRVSIPWASTLRAYNHLSPNMLLYWQFIQYAAEQGYSQFDFGRSSPNEGTYKFKAQWGAKPIGLHWHYWMFNGKKIDRESSGSAKRQWFEKVWQKMPLTLTNTLGPLIRKQVSL